jgi:hypothetical protein
VTKGSSSLTYEATLVTGDDGTADGAAGRETTAYVKVAPPGLEPVRNRDVLRQAGRIDTAPALTMFRTLLIGVFRP